MIVKFNKQQPMRRIDMIIVHCSDSDHKHHDNIETIRKWHVKERGFNDVGYHFVITKDGSVVQGRNLAVAGAHCKGYNAYSIGICLTGKKEFSKAQFASLQNIIEHLRIVYGQLPIYHHNEIDKSKTCPNFNITEETGLIKNPSGLVTL